jgi:hypothetical protein
MPDWCFHRTIVKLLDTNKLQSIFLLSIVEKSKDRSCIRGDALPAALWPPSNQNSAELIHHGQIDVKIRLQDYWVKLRKYRPVSWFADK